MEWQGMIDGLVKFSGIGAMVMAWGYVVAPAIRYGINGKTHTISSATKDFSVRSKVTFGLLAGTMFQAIFLVYLMEKFSITLLHFSSLLYVCSLIATVCVAIFPEPNYPKIHEFFAKFYFVAFPFSLLLVSLVYPASYGFIALYFLGTWWLVKNNGITAHVEQWAFLILSLWTLVLTFT